MAFACAAFAAGAVRAAGVYTNSASGNWNADASWTGDKPSAGGAADAAVVFNGTGTVASTNNLSGTFLLNRMDVVSGAVALSGNALAFTNNGATGPQVSVLGGSATFLNSLALGNDTVFYAVGAVTNVGAVSGKGGLIKTGSGELFCATNGNGALSYSGTTLVSGGMLTIATSTSRNGMNSSNITVQGGATLRTLGGLGVSALPVFSDRAAVNVESNGTINSDVPTISCGTLTAASGAVITGGNGCLSLHATDTVSSVVATLGSLSLRRIILEPYTAVNPLQTLRFDGTGSGLSIGTDSGTAFSLRTGSSSGLMTFIMDVGDSPSADVDLLVPFLNFRPGTGGFALVKRGTGVMQVNGQDWSLASTPTMPVACSVEAGTLVWNSSTTNAVGVNFASVTTAAGGTFQLGTNSLVGAVYVDVTDNGTLAFCRSDTVVFSNAVSGSGSLVQRGRGTLTLTGTSPYSGGTTVSSGTLLVNAPGKLTGGGDVAVTGGTLGGNGAIAGPVALGSAGTLLPGGSNTVGTLTLSNAGANALTLTGGTLLFDVSNVSDTCDQVAVAGTLVLNGANLITFAFPNGTPPAGTYTLLTYAAKAGAGTLALKTFYPNTTLTVSDTSATLTVSGPGIRYLKWNGNVSGTWDTTTANWLLESVASTYAEGTAVLFDDTAVGNYTVGASGSVSPSSVTFDNSVSNYVLSAGIAGANAVMIKAGSKKTTLSGSNTYGGGTILSGGTLSVGSSANLPTGALTFNGGTLQITGTTLSSFDAYTVNWGSFNGGLDLASGDFIVVTNAIGGVGSLSKSGAGTLVLSGTNTYGGGTTVNAGYLRVSNAQALGPGSVNMTGVDCELNLMGGLVFTNAITVRSDGLVNSAGSLQSYYGTSNTWSGPVTLGDGNARIGAPGAVLVVNGVIDSGVNAYDLIIRNPNDLGGTVVLAATNAWRGNLWVRCGTVRVGIRNAVPVTSILHLGLEGNQTGVSDSVFDLAGFDQTIVGLVDRGTDNLHVVTNGAAMFSTLTVNVASSSAYAYAGTLAGKLNVAKTGAGTLTLAGTNTTFGGFSVNAGTLVLSPAGTCGVNCTNIAVNAGTLTLSNSVSIADSAVLRVANGGTAKVNLASGVNESVGYLFFNDRQRPGGTYGATGSGARVIDDEHFAGTGVLTVLHGNGGTVIRFL
jgi:autotransporter-associated beta strand protein